VDNTEFRLVLFERSTDDIQKGFGICRRRYDSSVRPVRGIRPTLSKVENELIRIVSHRQKVAVLAVRLINFLHLLVTMELLDCISETTFAWISKLKENSGDCRQRKFTKTKSANAGVTIG